MTGMLEFPLEHMKVLNECDLSSKRKIEHCAQVANNLLEIIESEIPTGLRKMKVKDRSYSKRISCVVLLFYCFKEQFCEVYNPK
jgi:hypothetical protein